MKIPLVADLDKSIAKDYGVLIDGGVSLRYARCRLSVNAHPTFLCL